MITKSDRYCYVNGRGQDLEGRVFKVIKFGTDESTIQAVDNNDTHNFYNAHLYATIDLRRRSTQERIVSARAIGKTKTKPGKR